MTRGLILTGDRNVHGNDYLGAFRPEAERLLRLHPEGEIHQINVGAPLADRHVHVMDLLRAAGTFDWLACVCHGWTSGVQVGLLQGRVDELARLLQEAGCHQVALYACSTGANAAGAPGGDGGFADGLRDALCRAGVTDCRVDAHDTVGHVTENPHCVRFEGAGSPTGGHGGSYIVAPTSDLWPRWCHALVHTDLRLRWPWMTTAAIHTELLASQSKVEQSTTP